MSPAILRSRLSETVLNASPRRFVLAALGALAFMCVPAGPASAGEMAPTDSTVTGVPSILDGQVFSGEMGALGKAARSTDTWIFEDGTFMSMQCEKCGFPRGVYRTERDGERISFVAETPCPRTDARIVWRGTVENDRIEGVYTWTKTRWYRTIEKEFWFEGTLVPREQAATE